MAHALYVITVEKQLDALKLYHLNIKINFKAIKLFSNSLIILGNIIYENICICMYIYFI